MVARAYSAPPRLNHGDRIVALEHRQDAADKQLTDMSGMVKEMHAILTGFKAVLWVAAKIGGLLTVVCAVIGAGVAILKYLAG